MKKQFLILLTAMLMLSACEKSSNMVAPTSATTQTVNTDNPNARKAKPSSVDAPVITNQNRYMDGIDKITYTYSDVTVYKWLVFINHTATSITDSYTISNNPIINGSTWLFI